MFHSSLQFAHISAKFHSGIYAHYTSLQACQ